ncbi:mucin-5AC-like isoform X2 [Schistocerca gregaria]|uniref:mucin-5AC-like isoform X2 n=1 Tax=Schistocerca gregaria TaxID=7010 RepID=UPI00211DF3E4|nr:mucin-5AC-like isoform X2 [Schistocerca gregaria]
MSNSPRSSSDVPGDRSRESAVEGGDESGRTSAAFLPTSRSEPEDAGAAASARSPAQKEKTSPSRQPVQRPHSLSLSPAFLPPLKPHTSSPVALPLAQSTPTGSTVSPLPSATWGSPSPQLLSPPMLTPSSTDGESLLPSAEHSARLQGVLPLYTQFKNVVAEAQREASEGVAGSRTKTLRPRSSLSPSFRKEFSTDYKSKPRKRKKLSGSKKLLTGKHRPKGRQAELAASKPPPSPPPAAAAAAAAAVAAAVTQSIASDVKPTSKSTRSPSAVKKARAVGVSHQHQPSTVATPATSSRGPSQGGSGGKSAPTRRSTSPRKEPRREKSRSKDHEAGGEHLPKPLLLSPCKVSLARLPSKKIPSTGGFWSSARAEAAVTETSLRDTVSASPTEGQRGIPLTEELVKKRRGRPPRKSSVSTEGQVKKRKDHQPLKAATLSKTSTGGVAKKRKDNQPLKAATLSKTSTGGVAKKRLDNQPLKAATLNKTSTGGVAKKRKDNRPLKAATLSKTSTGGVAKKCKDRLPLKAAILDTSTAGVTKKRRGQSALKAAILATMSEGRKTSSMKRSVKCSVEQKALSETKKTRKKTELSIPTNIPVTSDLAFCLQRAQKQTAPFLAQKPKRKSTTKGKAPFLHKQTSNSVQTSEHRKKASDLRQTNKDKAQRLILKLRKERMRKTSVTTIPLKTVSALESTSQSKRQSASGLPHSSLEGSSEGTWIVAENNIQQWTGTGPDKVGETTPERRSRRSAAMLARQAIVAAFEEEAEEEEAAAMDRSKKQHVKTSPEWKISSGPRNPICWVTYTSKSNENSKKALVRKRILQQQDNEGPSRTGTSDDDSVTFVLDDLVQTVDSMNSALQEIKLNSSENAECSHLPSTAPLLVELTSSVQEPQPTTDNGETDGGSTTTATNQSKIEIQNLAGIQTSPVVVKEPRRRQSSGSQSVGDAAVAASPEVITADVGSASGQGPEAEDLPRGRCSSLGSGSTWPSPYTGSRGRSRSSSPPTATRSYLRSNPTDYGCANPPNSDRKGAQFNSKHWKKHMILPSEQHQQEMSYEDQRETENRETQSAITEHVVTHVVGRNVPSNTAGDGYATSRVQQTSENQCDPAGDNLPEQRKSPSYTLPSYSSKYHRPWRWCKTEDTEDNDTCMPIDLSLPTVSGKFSVPEVIHREHADDTTGDVFPVQETTENRREPADDCNLSVGHRGVQTFPSWSLKSDTSWSVRKMGRQSNIGEVSTAIERSPLTTRSESSISEIHRVHSDSTTGDVSSPLIPVPRRVEKRCESTGVNLSLRHRRVEALSSWSLKLNSSWSETEMEIQEDSGEGVTVPEAPVATTRNESLVPEMLHRQQESSSLLKPSTSSSLSLAKERASSDDDPELL